MYKLLLIIINNGIGNKSNEDITETITEYKRQKVETSKTESENDSGKSDSEYSTKNAIFSDNDSVDEYQYQYKYNHKMIPKEIKIEINKMDCIPSNIEERFNLYLDKFNSNTLFIKSLPYYLIPLASSLRYYLNEKKRLKQYIFDYEFEALVAASIAALTLTFLNINSYKSNNNNLSIHNYYIEKNIKENYYRNINRLLNEQRLELYKYKILNKNKILDYMNYESSIIQLKRNTQILAKFRNVLSINSNIMQILKLTDDLPEFQWLSTMHHYIWEEAYHAIVFQIKNYSKPNTEDISKLFNKIFFINDMKNNDENFNSYLKYLNKNYHMVLRSIGYNKYNTFKQPKKMYIYIKRKCNYTSSKKYVFIVGK